MTDIHAALGHSQLARIDEFVQKRHAIADFYDRELQGLPLSTPKRSESSRSALHLYVVRLEMDRISKSKKKIFEELHALGIMVNLHYIPIHLQPYYEKLGFEEGQYPESEKYYEEAVTLPLHPGMSLDDQKRVVSSLKEVLS
jgi:dTDP-4-amino-4,6-dideoxygalactose transaminase